MAQDKIKTREELAEILNSLKGNKRVVFTNGCFDVLHRGHIEYLYFAKKLGDLLVVAVNSDESVRKLKGEGRPINKLEDRMAVLSSLEMVDYVIPFEEDTPYEVIKLLKPDIIVKGGDYTPDEVVGKDIVEGYGGKVVIAPYLKGYSTTELLRRMKND
ncbi:MAG: D-glycero-beta-D-manno-heptose 1-phosphate adenylyltransferase [bacterium]|nr:D-glycero-beta-D-manno-heptose 1-phosphate adenylyltransferase [bacterium]